jgi:hypothetical protein
MCKALIDMDVSSLMIRGLYDVRMITYLNYFIY